MAAKAPRQRAKDLSAFGKKSYYNVDKTNRGLGSAAKKPKNWDENSVGKMEKG